jgi:hypothetical protein
MRIDRPVSTDGELLTFKPFEAWGSDTSRRAPHYATGPGPGVITYRVVS